MYMIDVLHFTDSFSTCLFGIAYGSTYVLQIVGGYVCDRYLGNRKAIIFGISFIVIAQLIFSYDAHLFALSTGIREHSTLLFTYPEIIFLIGVAVMAVGVSFFKVNIASFIDQFYNEGDSKLLDSAFSIYGDGERICRESLDRRRLERYAARIAARNFKKPSGKIGLEKMRLLDAITPKGYYFLNGTVEALCNRKTVFEDDFGVAASIVIGEIRTYALASGFSVISSPFIANEKKIRHIIIPQLGLGFFTKDKLCSPSPEGAKYVSLKRFYDTDALRNNRAKLNFAKKASKELIDEAVSALKNAKEVHDELESIYIRAMDFSKVEEKRKEISKRIWESEWWPEE